MHSLAQNHPLADGNERLCLAGGIVVLGVDGYRLTMSNDEACEFVTQIGRGEVTEVAAVTRRLERGSERYPR